MMIINFLPKQQSCQWPKIFHSPVYRDLSTRLPSATTYLTRVAKDKPLMARGNDFCIHLNSDYGNLQCRKHLRKGSTDLAVHVRGFQMPNTSPRSPGCNASFTAFKVHSVDIPTFNSCIEVSSWWMTRTSVSQTIRISQYPLDNNSQSPCKVLPVTHSHFMVSKPFGSGFGTVGRC